MSDTFGRMSYAADQYCSKGTLGLVISDFNEDSLKLKYNEFASMSFDQMVERIRRKRGIIENCLRKERKG